jgi:hypothetical protein
MFVIVDGTKLQDMAPPIVRDCNCERFGEM